MSVQPLSLQFETRAQPRLSTARKRTPLAPSSNSARLSSAQTARHTGGTRGSFGARDGLLRAGDSYAYASGYPVQASPAFFSDESGMGALRRVAENLFTTIVLQLSPTYATPFAAQCLPPLEGGLRHVDFLRARTYVLCGGEAAGRARGEADAQGGGVNPHSPPPPTITPPPTHIHTHDKRG
ncbi:hypothetical protein T492DRAFT_841078 [Pavlovales sp. CCMP2436]|nr:hypothetical protein T492DRAFT_841078 [Pavlovales sp. CCMP2436]